MQRSESDLLGSLQRKRAARRQHIRSRQVDFLARYHFLAITTQLWHPAPIDTLLAAADEIRPWFSSLQGFEARKANTPLEQELQKMLFEQAANLERLKADPSPEAAKACAALQHWAAQHDFQDAWILDAGLFTLAVQAVNGTTARRWYIRCGDALEPKFEALVGDFWRADESPEQFRVRAEGKFREKLNDYMAQVRQTRGLQKTQRRVALWAASRFTGLTWERIAERERQDPDSVRKQVTAFARRARLTLPTRSP